jgi:hypothetical protein
MAENLAWLCVGLFPICVTLALPVALIAIVGGLAGLAADRRRKGLMWLVSLFVLGVGACMLLVLVGNRFSPEPSPPTSWPKYHIMDEQMEPFVSAISVVDPTSLGFTPIPADAWVEISPYPMESGYGYPNARALVIEYTGGKCSGPPQASRRFCGQLLG